MKKLIFSVMLLMALIPTTGKSQTTAPAWPELKNFHSLMSATFHPTEEGNFKPLKQKADSLVTAAKNWLNSTIPADYKPSETKSTLKKLLKQCEAINKAVLASATDDKLKAMITTAHEIFHTIVEKCRTPEK